MTQITATSVDSRIESLLQEMTLAEKIGQMTQVEKDSIQPDDVTNYFIGSVLSGGGGNPPNNSPETWREMVMSYQDAALQTRLKIPLMYGSDAVHGHSNMKGSVIFPHNIGLGAARDADLVRRIARITALEMLAVNVHWNFAPAVSVPQDIRWGRTYEGYGENADIVRELGVACIQGLQDSDPRALASVKHYVGDGGTGWGTTQIFNWVPTTNWQAADDRWSIDQGVAEIDEATLRAVHLSPYIAAIEAGALNIMVSFSSWQDTKMHAHKYLLTDVLKGELGFEGFLVSDWMAIYQIDPDYSTCVTTAINAGLDMIMVPYDYKLFIQTLTSAVQDGKVPMDRIDDAVRRVLKAKVWLGLFEQPMTDESLLQAVGSPAHREVAREAVRKSLVLLKNEKQTLPLPKNPQKILVGGRGADNIGMQCGGWSIEWLGAMGSITTGTSILEGIQQAVADNVEIEYSATSEFTDDLRAAIGIVVVGEDPYAEGTGDKDNLILTDEDQSAIEKMRQRCEKLIVILLSGRPLIITDQLAVSDAFIAAWLPGTEGHGIADVLFGDYPFIGKLSYNWLRNMEQVPLTALQAHPDGPLFPQGYGLR